jgi:hypothetical protein
VKVIFFVIQAGKAFKKIAIRRDDAFSPWQIEVNEGHSFGKMLAQQQI